MHIQLFCKRKHPIQKTSSWMDVVVQGIDNTKDNTTFDVANDREKLRIFVKGNNGF